MHYWITPTDWLDWCFIWVKTLKLKWQTYDYQCQNFFKSREKELFLADWDWCELSSKCRSWRSEQRPKIPSLTVQMVLQQITISSHYKSSHHHHWQPHVVPLTAELRLLPFYGYVFLVFASVNYIKKYIFLFIIM